MNSQVLRNTDQSLPTSSSYLRAREISVGSEVKNYVDITEWKGLTSTNALWEVYCGDSLNILAQLKASSYNCVVTSPPYFWQRDYNVKDQIGMEQRIEQYVEAIVSRMDQVKRVLKKDGTLFLNLGDTYYSAKGQPKGNDKKNGARRFGLRAVDASGLGVPRKTTIGIPWRVALEMIAHGWILRSPIVWQRNGSLPEPSAKDRPWRTYEFIFLFTKSPHYYFNRDGLNGEEDIWLISSRPKHSRGVHAAAFPDELVQRCLTVGCPAKGTVLDPFAGSGTVLRVALAVGREVTGIDLSPKYCDYMVKQLRKL